MKSCQRQSKSKREGQGEKNRDERVVGDSQSPTEKGKWKKKAEKKQRGESCWRQRVQERRKNRKNAEKKQRGKICML